MTIDDYVEATPRTVVMSGGSWQFLQYEAFDRFLSGTRPAGPAQYRAACRAQSTKDFIAKMKKLEEEADESAVWLALLRADGLPATLARENRWLDTETATGFVPT